MEKKILESDPQKDCDGWFDMATPTGKESKLPSASNSLHVPCNTSQIQLLNRGFAQTSQRNNNVGVSNSPSHLLSPFSRPSPLRRSCGNNYLNSLGAIRSAAISPRATPLANLNLAEGTDFPMANPNNPIFSSLDNSTHKVNPNRSVMSHTGLQTEIPTSPGHSRNNPWSTSGNCGECLPHFKNAQYITQFHFFPHVGEGSISSAPTPISFFKDDTPRPRSGLYLSIQAPQGIPADLSGIGDVSASAAAALPSALGEPEFPHFCSVCLLLSHDIDKLIPEQEAPEEHDLNPLPDVNYRFGQTLDGPILASDTGNNLPEAKRAPKWQRHGLGIYEPVGGERRRNTADHVAAPEAQEARRLRAFKKCNASFRSWNALGRHMMSTHVRKRKTESMNDIDLDIDDDIHFKFDDDIDIDDDIEIDDDLAFVEPLFGGEPDGPAVEAAVSVLTENSGKKHKESPWAMF